jgi:hypothetical protein
MLGKDYGTCKYDQRARKTQENHHANPAELFFGVWGANPAFFIA